jgi:hypothetical protein
MSECEVISVYALDDAVRDGIYKPVSELLSKQYFKWPVLITTGVDEICKNSEGDYNGVLHDILTMLYFKIKSVGQDDNFISFDVVVDGKTITLWATIQVDNNGQPNLTIMLPEEY